MTYKLKLTSWILIILGLLIVFGTHIPMLFLGLPEDQIMAHTIINLLAGLLLLIGIMMKR